MLFHFSTDDFMCLELSTYFISNVKWPTPVNANEVTVTSDAKTNNDDNSLLFFNMTKTVIVGIIYLINSLKRICLPAQSILMTIQSFNNVCGFSASYNVSVCVFTSLIAKHGSRLELSVVFNPFTYL